MVVPISSPAATFFSILLFSIGLMGVLTRRNLIVIFVSVELMLNAVNLNLLALFRQCGEVAVLPFAPEQGDSIAIFVILLAACEVAVGLGILLGLSRIKGSVSVEDITELKN